MVDGARSPNEYHAQFPAVPVPGRIAVETAIKLLMPGARRRAHPAIVDGRVSWETVRAWRYGRRAVPQWALDLIAAKLAPFQAGAELAKRASAGRGLDWKRKR